MKTTSPVLKISQAVVVRQDAHGPVQPDELHITGPVDRETVREWSRQSRDRVEAALRAVVDDFVGSEPELRLKRLEKDLAAADADLERCRGHVSQAERQLEAAFEAGRGVPEAEARIGEVATALTRAEARKRVLDRVVTAARTTARTQLRRQLEAARQSLRSEALSEWRAAMAELEAAVADRFATVNILSGVCGATNRSELVERFLTEAGFDAGTTFTAGHGYPVAEADIPPETGDEPD